MAALKAREVEAFLRKPEARFTTLLVYGPNAGLVSERAAHLARASVDDPSDPFQLIRLDGDDIAADPLRLADEANTMGLFGGRRCLWIRTGSRPLTTAVEPILKVPPRDARVVIEAGDLPARHALRVMVESSPNGAAVPCYDPDDRDLVGFAEETLRADGMALEPDARGRLMALLSTDRLLQRRELEKLALYAAGQRSISADDVDAVMADDKALAADKLVDAVFVSDLTGVERGLRKLLAEGEDPGVLVGKALRVAIDLHKQRLALDSGTPLATLTQRVFFARKAAVERQLTRWTATALEGAIATLREAQGQIRRNGRIGEVLASRVLTTVALRGGRG